MMAKNLESNGQLSDVRKLTLQAQIVVTSACTEEKLQIIKSKSENLLNKRNELFSKCCHRNKFSAWNFKRKN